MKSYGILIINVLIVSAILLSIFGYMHLLEENTGLTDSLGQQEAALQAIDSEKKELVQELGDLRQEAKTSLRVRASLKEALLVGRGRVSELLGTYSGLLRLNEELAIRVAKTRQENLLFVQGRDSMLMRFNELINENDDYRARFNSDTELKKAIREFKRTPR